MLGHNTLYTAKLFFGSDYQSTAINALHNVFQIELEKRKTSCYVISKF